MIPKMSEDAMLYQEDKSIVANTDGIIQFKIVYWGPGQAGKTTNFHRLKEIFDLVRISKGYSIETTDGRTLWQDAMFLSYKLTLGDVRLALIVQVVTCTGQERFLSTREYVLQGADGIVFVADSGGDMMEQNKRSFRELIDTLKKKNLPFVVQLNKRDLEGAIPIESFKKQLGLPLEEKYDDDTLVVYPANAIKGDNVIACFRDLMFQVLYNYLTGA